MYIQFATEGGFIDTHFLQRVRKQQKMTMYNKNGTMAPMRLSVLKCLKQKKKG